jgi:raffinose/stachyose/melibiose transport system permease protein
MVEETAQARETAGARGRVSRLAVLGSRRHGGPRKAPWILVVPAVVLVTGFFIVAPALGVRYAFTDWNGLSHARWIGLGNFREIFRSPETSTALWNTLKLAGAFFVLVNILGLGLALALNRVLRTRFILRSIFFLPVVVIPLATSYIWEYIFDYTGPLNKFLNWAGLHSWVHPWLGDPGFALWTILIVMLWQYTGLTMVLYLAGLAGIPQELDEAAAVDGATTWTRFRRVTLPLLAPAITVAATLTTIIGLRTFDQILALTGGGPVYASETLSTEMYKQTFAAGRFGYGAALALVLTVLILVLAITQVAILRRGEART